MKLGLVTIVVIGAVIGMTACSEPAKTSAVTEAKTEPPPGPPQPISAKTAYWEMYKPARTWAADLMPIGMSNVEVEGLPLEQGKSMVWTVAFVSTSQHQLRTYTYSVVNKAPVVYKGVKADSPLPWSGPVADAMPFPTSDFAIDSDAAYKTAAEKADAWLKKHEGKVPVMKLGHATRYPAPMWYLMWGDKKDGYVAYVNATTGTFGAK